MSKWQKTVGMASLKFQGGWDYHPQIGYTTPTYWARFELVSHAQHGKYGYVLFRGQDNSMVWAYLQTADTTAPTHLQAFAASHSFQDARLPAELDAGDALAAFTCRSTIPTSRCRLNWNWVTAEQPVASCHR